MSPSAPSAADRKDLLYEEAFFAAALGLGVNLGLFCLKLLGGIFGASIALASDAVNSLGDSTASFVVLIALSVARTPPDDEHPYGHTRAEAIAASTVAVLILLSALGIGYEAVRSFGVEGETPPWWTLLIAGGNVIIKELVYRYKLAVGERLGSSALIAGAWDHRSDALSSSAVFVGLLVVIVFGPEWAWVEKLAALVVVVAIVWSGVRLYSSSAHELMDAQADPELVSAIRQTAVAVPGICDVEKLWVRKSGLEYFADIHIEVDSSLTVQEGHTIGHAVKDRLLSEHLVLRDVLVHLEPHPHRHEPAGSERGLAEDSTRAG